MFFHFLCDLFITHHKKSHSSDLFHRQAQVYCTFHPWKSVSIWQPELDRIISPHSQRRKKEVVKFHWTSSPSCYPTLPWFFWRLSSPGPGWQVLCRALDSVSFVNVTQASESALCPFGTPTLAYYGAFTRLCSFLGMPNTHLLQSGEDRALPKQLGLLNVNHGRPWPWPQYPRMSQVEFGYAKYTFPIYTCI